ncbi:tyrosine-type recombinase/integrase [Chloroflexota bacterium]
MRGCIIERNGSLRLKVSLGKNPQTGKYESYYETFHGNRTEAQKRLRQVLTELDKGIFTKPSKTTVADYLNTWLQDYCKPSLSPRTLQLYSYICRVHVIPAIGKVALTELKSQHLQKLYSEKIYAGLSARTVQICHVAIHKALKNAVRINLVSRNVADAVDKPKIQRTEMHPMTERDLSRFLEAAKQGHYYALFYTYLFTGMRRSELLAIRWCDVELLGMQISVSRTMQYLNGVKNRITFKEPKSKKSRRLIALSPSTVFVLEEHLKAQDKMRESLQFPPITENDLVFSHWDGSPLLPDSITHAWVKLVRKCGLKGIRLHDARHTHATIMLKQGVHPKVVQERLGHSTISTTLDTYSHVAPGLQQAAARGFDDILKKDSTLDKELAEILQN